MRSSATCPPSTSRLRNIVTSHMSFATAFFTVERTVANSSTVRPIEDPFSKNKNERKKVKQSEIVLLESGVFTFNSDFKYRLNVSIFNAFLKVAGDVGKLFFAGVKPHILQGLRESMMKKK